MSYSKMILMTTGNYVFINNEKNPTVIPRMLPEQCVCALCRKREVESSRTRSVTGPCEPRQCSILFRLR